MLELAAAIAIFAASKIAGDVSTSLYSKLVDKAAGDVIDAVLGTRDEQRALLSSIDTKVNDLLQGDFNAAMLFLERASKPHLEPELRQEALGKAADRFFDALGKEGRRPARAALIRLNLGATYVAMDQWIDAEDALEQATADGIAAVPGRGLFSAPMWKPAGLVGLLDAIREMRISLGALPTSVPSIDSIAKEPEEQFVVPLRLLAPGELSPDPYRPAESQAHPAHRLPWPMLPPSVPDLQTLSVLTNWQPALLERTPALLEIASAPVGPVSWKESKKVWGAFLVGTRSTRRHVDSELERTLVSGMAAERRAKWPGRHLARVAGAPGNE